VCPLLETTVVGGKEVRVWDTLCVLFKGNEEMRDVGGGKL
jgi:hypothetical protein